MILKVKLDGMIKYIATLIKICQMIVKIFMFVEEHTLEGNSPLQFCGIALSRRKDSCLRADSDWSEGKASQIKCFFVWTSQFFTWYKQYQQTHSLKMFMQYLVRF